MSNFTPGCIFTLAVKKLETVKIEGTLEPTALRILREVPGVSVVTSPPTGRVPVGDVVVRAGGASEPVAVHVKRQANAATAWQLVRQAEAAPQKRLMLVAGETTAEAREILERHGIAVIDGLGNAHIELPGLLVHLDGRRNRPRRVATRLTGKAGVGAQALLLRHDRPWKVKDLAREAGISIGLAHRVLARLESEALVTAEGAGPNRVRHVVDPTALLDLWTEENTDRGVRRVRAYLLARNPRSLADEVSAGLDRAGIEHAVTGAAAAQHLAPFVTSVSVTEVWLGPLASAEDSVVLLDAEVADTGNNLVFAQTKGSEPLAFRRKIDDVWMVNDMRLFLDLRSDPRRGQEQADRLREEVIGF